MLFAATSASQLWSKVQDQIINPLIKLLFVAAVVLFIFGIIEFIRGADDPKKREVGREHMIWGVVGMAIMGGAIGIVNILISTVTTF